MSSPKTNCKKCGTEIMQITADLNEGRCMPCKKADWRIEVLIPQIESMREKRIPILNHNTTDEEVLVSISFHPGFVDDLTSWVFHIMRNGVMRQSVSWYNPRRDRLEEELEPVRFDEAVMNRLRRLITEAESLELSVIEGLVCIDDVEIVSIRIPRSGERADIPMLHLKNEINKGRLALTEIEKSRFMVAEAIWTLADKHARHRVGQK